MAIQQRNVTFGGSASGSSVSSTVTVPSTAAGSTLVVMCGTRGSSGGSAFLDTNPVTDNKSTHYSQAVLADSTSGTVIRSGMWYADNVAAGINHVTVTIQSGPLDWFDLCVVELTGTLKTGGSLDATASNAATTAGTAASSGTGSSTTTTNQCVIGYVASAGTNTTSAPTFAGSARTISAKTNNGDDSEGATPVSLQTEFALLSGSTLGTISYAATLNNSVGWACGVATFQPAVGSASVAGRSATSTSAAATLTTSGTAVLAATSAATSAASGTLSLLGAGAPLTATVTLNPSPAPTNSILYGYEITSAGAVTNRTVAPTNGSTLTPTLTFATTPAIDSLLVIGVTTISQSGAAPTVASVSDPTNGAYTRAARDTSGAARQGVEQWFNNSNGNGVVDTSGHADWTSASTAATTGSTAPTSQANDAVIALLGWNTNTTTISALTGAFTSGAAQTASFPGGNTSAVDGTLSGTANNTAYTYSGTLSGTTAGAGVIVAYQPASGSFLGATAATTSSASATLKMSGQSVFAGRSAMDTSARATLTLTGAGAVAPAYVPVTTIGTRISARYATALQVGDHSIATRAELWLAGSLRATFAVEASSNIAVDRNNPIRRTCQAVLTEGVAVDPSGVNVPVVPTAAESLFSPFGSELILYRGITYSNGDVELIKLGVFGIETVQIDDSGADLVITVSASDRARAVQRAGFTDTYVVPPLMLVTSAIQALIASTNTGLTFNYNFVPSTILTPTTATVYQPGDDPLAKALELAASIGSELYWDRNGDCTLLPIPDPTTAPVNWSYDEGSLTLVEKLGRSVSRAKAANYIIRDGQGTGVGTPVRGVAQDLDPKSPTFVGGSYGVVVDYSTSSLYTSVAQCQVAAQAALRLALGTMEALTLAAIPKPDHEVDDVVEVTRLRGGVVGSTYVLDAFTLAMGPQSTLDMTCRSVLIGTGIAPIPPPVSIPPPPPAPPLAPITLAATPAVNSFVLTWNSDPNATSWIPYIAPSGQLLVRQPAVTVPTVTFSGLQSNATYTVAVAAKNSVGTSAQSAPLNVTTLPPAGGSPPGAPTGLTVSAATINSCHLVWTAPVGGTAPTSYTVYQGTNVVLTPTTNLFADPSGLATGTAYTFAVVANSGNGDGPPSNTASTSTTTSAAVQLLTDAGISPQASTAIPSPPGNYTHIAFPGSKYHSNAVGVGTNWADAFNAAIGDAKTALNGGAPGVVIDLAPGTYPVWNQAGSGGHSGGTAIINGNPPPSTGPYIQTKPIWWVGTAQDRTKCIISNAGPAFDMFSNHCDDSNFEFITFDNSNFAGSPGKVGKPNSSSDGHAWSSGGANCGVYACELRAGKFFAGRLVGNLYPNQKETMDTAVHFQPDNVWSDVILRSIVTDSNAAADFDFESNLLLENIETHGNRLDFYGVKGLTYRNSHYYGLAGQPTNSKHFKITACHDSSTGIPANSPSYTGPVTIKNVISDFDGGSILSGTSLKGTDSVCIDQLVANGGLSLSDTTNFSMSNSTFTGTIGFGGTTTGKIYSSCTFPGTSGTTSINTNVPGTSPCAGTGATPPVPSLPVVTPGSVGPTSFTATWSDAGTGNTTPQGYDWFLNDLRQGSVTQPTVTVTGLTPSTSYKFKVDAFIGSNKSAATADITQMTGAPLTCTIAPPAPTLAAASNVASTSLDLTWTDGGGGNNAATSYIPFNVTTSTALPAVAVPTLTIHVTGLTANTPYQFSVQAKNSCGTGVASNTISVTTATSGSIPPPTPTGLAVSSAAGSVTDTSVALVWADAGTGTSAPVEYFVYVGDATGHNFVATDPVAVKTKTVTGLTPNTTYTFKAYADNGAGTSAATAFITQATTGAPVTPPVPTNLQAPTASTTASSVGLTWADAGSPDGYTVYVGGVVNQTVTTTSANVAGLNSSQQYSFTVDAFTGNNHSVQTSALSVTTLPPPTVAAPPQPTGLATSAPTSSSLTLNWADSGSSGSNNAPTSYSFTQSPGTAPAAVTGSPPATTTTATALSSSTNYTFTVTASNNGGSSSPSAPATGKTSPPPTTTKLSTVVLMVLENLSRPAFMADPYFAKLANDNAQCTAYTIPQNDTYTDISKSLPHYMQLSGGLHVWGIDCDPCTTTGKSLVDLLESAGISWGSFSEWQDNPGTQDPLVKFPGTTGYDNHHNPWPHYANIYTNATRKAKIVDLSKLKFDSTMPTFLQISPTVYHDAHSASVAAASAWWQTWVPKVLNSSAFTDPNSSAVLIITTDNGANPKSANDFLYTVFAGPGAKKNFSSSTPRSHFDLLRTIEQGFGLGKLGTNDATANVMSEMLSVTIT